MSERKLVRFSGEIVKISDRFWGDGWGYGTLATATREIPVVGTLEDVTLGMKVLITGFWEDSKYGARVKLSTLVRDLPGTSDGVEAWLMHRLPQIGPIRAQDIAHRFGKDLWNVLDNDANRLTEVSGITSERAAEIHGAYTAFKAEREAFIEFFELGLTKLEARRVIRKLGPESHVQVAKDPYILYLDLGGFTFNRVEHIATARKIPHLFGPRLVSAVVEAARREAADNGDTVFNEDELLSGAARLIDDTTNSRHLRAALSQALVSGYLVRFGENFMQAAHYDAEATIANKILQLTGALEPEDDSA